MPSSVRHALLLHGAGGGAWEWNLWRAVLAASGVEPVALDLQPTAAGLVETRYQHYFEQAKAALVALPQPRVVIGASLGGLLALGCADAAAALVLVNPLPPAPWTASLPSRDWPDVVPWQREARLASTRRAMPDSDDATALFAYRHWRDESGAVLRAAHAGIPMARPQCPVLCVVSRQDEDVPPAITRALANEWGMDLIEADSPSHVGPLLGRCATDTVARVATWLSAR
ncbi:alpha/beta fold hydrolase [Lysobacter tyrosinilyticus]